MGKSDIEFTIGLNTSPAEQSLNNLFNDTNVYKGRLQKALNSGSSQQVYESKLRKYSNLIDRAGSDPRKMSTQDYNRFINLRNDIGRYERIIHNFSNTATKVLSQVNNYSGEKKLDPFVKDIATTERLRNYYSGGGDLQTKYEKAFAMGAYEQYKKLTTPSNILALPAPKSAEENALDNKTVTSRMNDDLKKIREKKKASIKEQKESVKEEKALNREHDAGIIKLFKITSILYGIKKLIQGLGKLWKFEVDTNLATTARDVQEKGFFSTDARNALRSNTNKERASIARGLQYMGEAAPFQMGDFDSAVKALQDLRLKAMSGQGIKDDQRVISLDRLTRRLGLNWNVGQMLSNPNLDLTGMLVDLSDAVERYLPKLDKLKDIDKNLTINDMLTVLGDKLMDAVVYHANYNARTGGTETMMEEAKKTGSDAHLPIDFTKGAHEFALAFADSVASSKVLKKAFAEWIRPPVQGVVNFKSHVSAAMGQWFERSVLNRQGRTNIDSLLVASNADLHGRDWKERKADQDWYETNKNVNLAEQEAFEKNSGYKTTNDLLNYYAYNDSAGKAGTISQNVENFAIAALANKYNDSGVKNLNELINNPTKYGISKDEVSLLKRIQKQHSGFTPRNLNEWQDIISQEKDFFKEGGVFDFKLGDESIEEYE